MESEPSHNRLNGFSVDSSTAGAGSVGVLEETFKLAWLSVDAPTNPQNWRKIDWEKVAIADEDMRDYTAYMDELCRRLPRSFDRLKRFLERGNCECTTDCQCFQRSTEQDGSCTCIIIGGNCTRPKKDGTSKNDTMNTNVPALEECVRIYSINPKQESDWNEFLKVDEYRASDPRDFQELQTRLYTDKHFQSKQGRQEEELSGDDSRSQVDEDNPFPNQECRLITVSHLSPRVARLLGAKFHISADFFNRNLPGTEAISGRLVSRLPSSVQIDFDEIYESSLRASEIWPEAKLDTQDDYAIEGHRSIKENIDRHFLFPVGWDHFPISRQDFIASTTNVSLKSGYEVLLKDSNDKMKNVFQFNLLHRISIYSEPVGHPRTAVIIFYPTLPFHAPGVNNIAAKKNLPVDEQPCECSLHSAESSVRFRSIPNAIPTPLEFQGIRSDKELNRWEQTQQKQAYASAYDIVLKLQLRQRLKEKREKQELKYQTKTTPSERSSEKSGPNGAKQSTDQKTERSDFDRFIRIFAAPVFRLVSANWARLVVRRSFDLDLLEWRSSNCLRSITIKEIKSRRVAITRHQRDIDASIDILHALAWGEKHKPIESHESLPSINLGRPNGFVAEDEDKDSWWSIYWDFYELKKSMDALEKRATKIYDSLVGEIQVVNLENSDISNKRARTLNIVGFLFTAILLPFTVIPAIFQTLQDEDGPTRTSHNFVKWILLCTVVLIVVMIILILFVDYLNVDYLNQGRLLRLLSSFFDRMEKWWSERDSWKGVIDDVNEQQRQHERKRWHRPIQSIPGLSSFPGLRKLRWKAKLITGDPIDISA